MCCAILCPGPKLTETGKSVLPILYFVPKDVYQISISPFSKSLVLCSTGMKCYNPSSDGAEVCSLKSFSLSLLYLINCFYLDCWWLKLRSSYLNSQRCLNNSQITSMAKQLGKNLMLENSQNSPSFLSKTKLTINLRELSQRGNKDAEKFKDLSKTL